jgi:hypothetical protein
MKATNSAPKIAPQPSIAAPVPEKLLSAKVVPAKASPVAKAKAKAPAPAAKAAVKPAAKTAVKASALKTAVKPAVKPVKPSAKAPAVKAKSITNSNGAVHAKPAQPAKAAAKPVPALPVEKEKTKKIKLVRDSFTMPEAEYEVLGKVKKACLKAGVEIKKSELLRIGVALIGGMDAASLKAVLATLPQLKSGRPVKEK